MARSWPASFTLPKDPDTKLAFIAGGIGVTPFRSMVQDLINRREQRPVVVLYGNDKVDEIAYAEVFDRAERELGHQDRLRGRRRSARSGPICTGASSMRR